jgi:hypothetical protein
MDTPETPRMKPNPRGGMAIIKRGPSPDKWYTPTLYSVGYSAPGWTPVLLAQATQEWKADVIDIRLVPHSPKPGWNQEELREVLGRFYLHIPAFGNKNYKTRGNIEIADMQTGLQRLAGAGA